MELIEVDSSALRRIGYDPDAEMLAVEFNNGLRYDYYNVPQQIGLAFLAAPSKGRFYGAHIKGQYTIVKL